MTQINKNLPASQSCRLQKDYSIPTDVFRDGYLAFQKKYTLPHSRIQTAFFIVLAVAFSAVSIYAGFQGKIQYLSYLLIVLSLASAVKSWYNPRKLRDSVCSAFQSIADSVYRVQFFPRSVEFSTIEQGEVENPLPQKSVLIIDSDFNLLEYDRFFLVLSGKSVFYILPKEIFTQSELQIVRSSLN